MADRPVLVILPGTLCDARLFDRQRRRLRTDMTVLTPSFSNWKSLDQWCADLLEVLPQRFYLAGFSLGGLIAFEILRRAADRVLGLALIASNANPANAKGRRRSGAMRRLWLRRGPKAVVARVIEHYFHLPSKRERHGPLIVAMACGTPRRSALGQFAWAAQRPSSLQLLHDYPGPVLAISGAKDRLCPTALQQAMQRAQPNMTWLEVGRCGHFVPLEASSRLTQSLRAWVRHSY